MPRQPIATRHADRARSTTLPIRPARDPAWSAVNRRKCVTSLALSVAWSWALGHDVVSDPGGLGQHGLAVAFAQAERRRHDMALGEVAVAVGQCQAGERQYLARGLAGEDGWHLRADRVVLVIEHGADD